MMSCPTENTWLRYVGGDLPDGSVQEIEEHLDRCASCRFLYADLARGERDAPATEPGGAIRLELPVSAPLPRGTTVGRYIILGLLGRGGMGVVYKAFDPELDRPIALKLVGLGGLGAEPEQSRMRLLREAKTLARLSHPNVVAVHDVGSYEDDLFVAMEFVGGVTLRDWLRERPRKPREILATLRAAGAGLAAAHRLGIVHRDFKPENIMVDDEHRVRVLDFGLARSLVRTVARPSLPAIPKAADAAATDATVQLTRDGMIVGTPAYMAPEQDLGHDVDARSDQFSFCAVLYEALYGRRAFAGAAYAELAERRLAGDVLPPPNIAGVTGKIRRALLRGLRVDPAERHRSMEALLVELGANRWTGRTRLAIAALAITAVAASSWALWVATHSPPTVEESCALAADDVNRVWNPTRRAELRSSLFAAKLADADAMFDRVSANVDRWTAEWSTRRTRLCAQMMRTDRGESEDTAEQLQCLRRRLSALDAAVSVCTHAASPEIAGKADALIANVALPSSCDPRTPVTITDEARQRWQPVIQGIVAARLAQGAGRIDEAVQTAVAALEAAKKLGEAEPLAAALMVLGQAQAGRSEFATARATLLEAIRAATTVREDQMVVESWLEIIGMAYRGFDDGLEHAMFSAEVAAERLPADHPMRVQVAYKVGSARALRGDFEAAAPLLQQAVASWTKADPIKHRLDIAGVENTLGLIHAARGEWDLARRNLEHSLASWETLGRPHGNVAVTLGSLGDLWVAQREHAKAEPLYLRAVAVVEAAGLEGRGVIAETKFQLAYFYVRTGRCEEARPLLAQAREHATTLHGASSSKVAMAMLGEGLCALERGHAAEAITILERAKPLADDKPTSLFQIPATDFALARALTAAGKDRRRAIALATGAREIYGRHAGLAADRAEVEAWLAARE